MGCTFYFIIFFGGGVLNLLFLDGSDFHLILIFYFRAIYQVISLIFRHFPSWGKEGWIFSMGGGGGEFRTNYE